MSDKERRFEHHAHEEHHHEYHELHELHELHEHELDEVSGGAACAKETMYGAPLDARTDKAKTESKHGKTDAPKHGRLI